MAGAEFSLPELADCNDGESGHSGLNCPQICLDDSLLFDPAMPVNLVNCGILASYCQQYDIFLSPKYPGSFQGITLAKPDEACASLEVWEKVQKNMTLCFLGLYKSKHSASSEQDLVPYGCTSPGFFADGKMESCFNALCDTVSLNPDIGGIGVSSSNPNPGYTD